MPTFTMTYKRRRYVVDAADRKAAYQEVLKQAAVLAAQNKAVKAEKLKHSMTCQCCGRMIFAEGGVIAHHGYTRPGDGWQTASCMGARHLPFEVNRTTLGVMIDGLRNTLAAKLAYRDAVMAETKPCTFEIEKKRANAFAKREYETVEVTRATFDTFRITYPGYCARRSFYDFDRAKASALAPLDNELTFYARHIAEQQARFDGWTQTHRRDGDAWVKL